MIKVRNTAKIKNQNNQITHLTRTPYRKVTKPHKRNIQESQEVSSFPAGGQKAVRNRQYTMTDTHKTQITKRVHKISQ